MIFSLFAQIITEKKSILSQLVLFYHFTSIKLMIDWTTIPQAPIKQHKIQMLFVYVEEQIKELLDKVTQVYKQNGIKYFVKPHHQFIMRLIVPYQLKVYANLTDVFCLFQNRNDLMRSAIQKDKFAPGVGTNFLKTKIQYPVNSASQNPFNNLNIPKSSNLQRKRYQEAGFQSMRKMNLSLMEQIVRKKICQWAKQQVFLGKNVTRKDVKSKAEQIAEKHNLRYGARWFKSFLSHDLQLRDYLTHGNSNQIKKSGALNNGQHQDIHQDGNKVKLQEDRNLREDFDEDSSAYGAFQDQNQEKFRLQQRIQQSQAQNNYDQKKRQTLKYPQQYNRQPIFYNNKQQYYNYQK